MIIKVGSSTREEKEVHLFNFASVAEISQEDDMISIYTAKEEKFSIKYFSSARAHDAIESIVDAYVKGEKIVDLT